MSKIGRSSLVTRNENIRVGTVANLNGAYSHPRTSFTDQLNLPYLWTVLARRKLLILVVTLSLVTPAALYSFLITPTYRSTVSIQIAPESVKVLPYSQVSDSLVRPSADFELYMKTQDVLLRSPALAAGAFERIKKQLPDVDLPMVSEDFSEGLSIERVSGSQIVNLNYLSYDAEFSALAANVVAEEFIELRFERELETTRNATSFLEGELEKLRKDVEKAEAEMIRYAQKHSILETGANQENVIRERYGQLSNQVLQSRNSYLAVKAEYDELEGVTVEDFPASLRGSEIANLEGSILETEQELSRLRIQFGENWPEVVKKRNDLEVLKKQLLSEKESAIDRAKRSVLLRLNTARGTYELLEKELGEQKVMVERLNQASVLYDSLRRDLEASEQLYEGLLQRLKETRVDPGLEFGNIHITDRAKASPKPYQPQPVLNIGLALILGLSAGIALAFFLDFIDPALRGPEQVESLGIPVLGWIPKAVENGAILLGASHCLPNVQTPEATEKKPVVHGHFALPQQRIVPRKGLIDPDLRVRESFRSLCASLLLSRAERPPRIILITSAVPGEGKTTITMNLGITLAETGALTLLVDSDFRKPSLSNRLGAQNGTGLSVQLAGGEIDIRDSQLQPNLCLFSAGPTPPNPVALFNSPRFSETLARLKQRFRFILLDGPPILSVAETSIIASKVDGVILVVKSAKTPKEVVARAHSQLERAGAFILGAAINHLNLRDPEYSYYSKYYYGYYQDRKDAESV